jgi:hypothetical protein
MMKKVEYAGMSRFWEALGEQVGGKRTGRADSRFIMLFFCSDKAL